MAAIALRPDSVRANPEPTPDAPTRHISRPAPIVPPGRDSFAQRATPSPLRRILLALEPWYDWGVVNISNMSATTFADEVHGDARYFDLQWLGVHIGLQFGHTPRARRRAAA